MINSNGQRPPIQFPAAGAIPIVGQPFEIGDFVVSALVTCKCDSGPRSFLASNTTIRPCPGCGKGYVIQGAAFAPGQPPQFNVGMVTPQAQPMGEG